MPPRAPFCCPRSRRSLPRSLGPATSPSTSEWKSGLLRPFAIHQSLQVVDTAYHAAGSTAIFEENPFERRFRDIPTVSQHLQGRSEHFETVGQYLIGLALDSLMWL